MRYLPLFILFFFLAVPTTQANEAMLQTMQGQMSSLQSLIKSLESTVQDLRVTVENQNEVIQQQNIRINGLEGKKSSSGQTANLPLKVAGLSQGFNPDIGVVGTVQAQLTENSEDAEGQDTIALKELELSFAQYVDPYSRLDAVIALNDNLEDQNLDIEEAYYSHWGLPWGFTGRIGKFRAKTGKQNLMHLHQLPTVDYPLVIADFFGEEGMSSSGVRLQNQIPNPFDIPLTVTSEVFRGNNGDSFGGVSRRPIFNNHISGFFELNEDINLDMGFNWMAGDENAEGLPEGANDYDVHIFGFDATFNWLFEGDRKLTFQNEFFYQSRSDRVDANRNPWGMYSLIDFRFDEKFSTGARFDLLEPRGIIDGHSPTTAVSTYLTFHQSEFANFQVQYQHLDNADPAEKSDDTIYLRANFLIGSHSHPVV